MSPYEAFHIWQGELEHGSISETRSAGKQTDYGSSAASARFASDLLSLKTHLPLAQIQLRRLIRRTVTSVTYKRVLLSIDITAL